jgi:hypothetical protein
MPSPTRTGRGKRAPKLDFPVTAEIIETSIPADSGHCMIADGLKAAVPHATDVSVDLATIRYTDRQARRRYVYLTPPEAQRALLDFDHGNKPEPFSIAAHAAQIVSLPPAKPKKPKAEKPERTDGGPKIPLTEPVSGHMETDEKILLSAAPADTTTAQAAEVPRKRQPAILIPNPAGGGTVPIKVGGKLPPMGAMPGGAGAHAVRTGRIRRFGLRAMGH